MIVRQSQAVTYVNALERIQMAAGSIKRFPNATSSACRSECEQLGAEHRSILKAKLSAPLEKAIVTLPLRMPNFGQRHT
jgi:hypothetical protein